MRTECPRCGEEVYFEEGFLYDDDVEISCPECGESSTGATRTDTSSSMTRKRAWPPSPTTRSNLTK